MTESPCIRCEHPVLLEGGHLVYCSQCGAPQIFLSDELRDEIADRVRAFEERHTVAVADALPNTQSAGPARKLAPFARPAPGETLQPEMVWSAALRYALLSAAVTLGLGLLSLLVPPLGLLVIVWIVVAPVATVGFFQARSRAEPASPASFGARLGLVTGLLIAVCCATVFTLSLVLARFAFHNAGQLDTQLAATFAQQRAIVTERLGAEAKPTLDLLNKPEYRVGLLMVVLGMSGTLYLALSTVGGGVAGLLLSRRRIT